MSNIPQKRDLYCNAMPQIGDPFLEEIRAIKQEISEQFGNDVRRLGRQLQIEQKVHGPRLVRNPRNKAKAS